MACLVKVLAAQPWSLSSVPGSEGRKYEPTPKNCSIHCSQHEQWHIPHHR